jgi:hypothetical protein
LLSLLKQSRLPGICYHWLSNNYYYLGNQDSITNLHQLNQKYIKSKNPTDFVEYLSTCGHLRDNAIVITYALMKIHEKNKLIKNENLYYANSHLFKKIILKYQQQKYNKVKRQTLINLWSQMKTQYGTVYKPWVEQYVLHFDNTKEIEVLNISHKLYTDQIAQLNVKLQNAKSKIDTLEENINVIRTEQKKYVCQTFKNELDAKKQIDLNNERMSTLKKQKNNIIKRNSFEAQIYGKTATSKLDNCCEELSNLDVEINNIQLLINYYQNIYDEKQILTKIDYELKIKNIKLEINKLQKLENDLLNELETLSEKLKIINEYILRQSMRFEYEKYMAYYNIKCDISNLNSIIYACNLHRQKFILNYGSHGNTNGYHVMTYCTGIENFYTDTEIVSFGSLNISPLLCEGFWTTNIQCGCGNKFKWNQDGFDACDVTKFSILSNHPYGEIENAN